MTKAEVFECEIKRFEDSNKEYDDYIRFILEVKKIFEDEPLGGCTISNVVKSGLA